MNLFCGFKYFKRWEFLSKLGTNYILFCQCNEQVQLLIHLLSDFSYFKFYFIIVVLFKRIYFLEFIGKKVLLL